MDSSCPILLVEDDIATREAMTLVLEAQGYEVSSAANGQEALIQLRGGYRPALILLDLMMPILDGWGFRARQQQDPALASIPVVLLTADTSIADRAAALGAADYVLKPVEIEQMLVAIKHALGTPA